MNSESGIGLDCSKDSDMSLLKALANFKLPIISTFNLSNVPANSELVRAFVVKLRNIKNFSFYRPSNDRVMSSKYIRELRLAAENTTEILAIKGLIFTVEDFKSLVVSARHVKFLSISDSWIPLDCKFDFGDQLDSSEIQFLSMSGSGSLSCGNWGKNPQRFENLLKAISNSLPLRNSLNFVDITNCEVPMESVEQLRKKYGLNKLKIY